MGNYSYVLCRDGHGCCFKDTHNSCNSAILAIISRPEDEEYLNDASKEINSILDRVRKRKHDPESELALLSIPDKNSDHNILLLAWVMEGVTGDSSVDDIVRILPTA